MHCFTSECIVCKSVCHGRTSPSLNATWPRRGRSSRRGSSTGSAVSRRCLNCVRRIAPRDGPAKACCSARGPRRTAPSEYVVRIPPAGGGIFRRLRPGRADPDPGTAARVRHRDPIADSLRARQLVDRLEIPRDAAHRRSYAVGHLVCDAGVAARCGADVQRRVHDSFLGTWRASTRSGRRGALARTRPTGVGNSAELAWWREYVEWGTDNQVPDVMTEAFTWLLAPPAEETGDVTVCWGDARLSNAIFDDSGQIVGALDWEQACLCPRRNRFRLVAGHPSTDDGSQRPRRRSRVAGLRQPRRVIRRYEEMIGRPLSGLGVVRDFRDGADGMLHPAHAGSAAHNRSKPTTSSPAHRSYRPGREKPSATSSVACRSRVKQRHGHQCRQRPRRCESAPGLGSRRNCFLVDLYTFSSKWRIRHFSVKKMEIPPFEMGPTTAGDNR